MQLIAWCGLLYSLFDAKATLAACTITSTNISFGNVDVLANTTVDTTGTVTVTCSGGSPPNNSTRSCVNIGAGPLGDSTSRVLSGSGGATLRYDLYQDAGRTTKFGSWQSGYDAAGETLNVAYNSSSSLTVYARLFSSQQTATAASYSASFAADPSATYVYNPGSATCPTGSSSTTGSFTVSATVLAKCNVSATNVNFGTIGVLSTAVDATGTIIVQCSNGLPYTVSLNGGNAGATDPTQRKMTQGASQITYALYRNSSRTLGWGSSSGVNTQGGTGTGVQQNLTVYGRVPSQTTPAPGLYSDAVVVTVTY